MRQAPHNRSVRNAESGYALVLMMFFLALLVLSTVAVAPTVLSNIQREKEAEMVWRGRQYVRGVRMYYMKMHRFPTSLDDLTKPKTGIRFMRQAYKDPMNQVDGSWRLIYVGPSGQLIGSLKNSTVNLSGQAGSQPAGGMQATSSSTSAFGSSSFGNSAFGNSISGNSSASGMNQLGGSAPGGAMGTAMGTALQNSPSTTDANAQNPNSSSDSGQPQPLAVMDASNTIGGNIIGVGSKVNKKSFRWYDKAKTYMLFEFIWDPSKDMTVGGASVGIGTPVQNTNGTNPLGSTNSSPASGINSNQNPSQNQNLTGNPDPNQNPPLQAPPPNQ